MPSRCSTVLGEVGRTIEQLVAAPAGVARPDRRLLDVGCWDGERSVGYAQRAAAMPFGIEIDASMAAAARARGLEVAEIDLETDRFPWPDGHFDIVVANQVLEHLKNAWLSLGEMTRVLAPGGIVVLSVPNLASLHNRFLLGIGRQPTSIRTIGPHVRGFAQGEFRHLVALGGALEVVRVLGVGFYPLPIRLSRPVARVWSGAAHTTVVVARRGSGPIVWRERLAAAAGQTHWSE